MKKIIHIFTIFAMFCILISCKEETKVTDVALDKMEAKVKDGIYRESNVPKIFTEWQDTKDKVISVSFASPKTTYRVDEEIIVSCAVKNNTDKPITLLRPFGNIYTCSGDFIINGPNGLLPYQGPIKEGMLGTGSFVKLLPKTIYIESNGLSKNYFPQIVRPGLYKISYTYSSNGYPKEIKPKNYWTGGCKTDPITILIKENPNK